MPSLEAPVSLKETRGTRIIHWVTQLLFWQGFLPEDTQHDLNFYIQNLTPCLSQFLLRHRYLRLGISWYRTCHPWIMIIYMIIKSFISHLFAIYLNRTKFDVVIDNAYPMFIWIFVFVSMSGIMVQKNEFNKLLNKLDEFVMKIKLTHDKQNDMFKEMDFYFNIFYKFMLFVAVPLFSIAGVMYTVVLCLPFRKLHFEEWYPYDAYKSPAYEITMLINLILFIVAQAASISLITSLVMMFFITEAYFKIICNKFENIRSMSLKIIKERKYEELQRRSRVFTRLQFGGNVDRFGRTNTERIEMSLPGLGTQGPRTPGSSNQSLCVRQLPQYISHREINLRNRIGNKTKKRTFLGKYVAITKNDIDKEMHVQLRKYIGLHLEFLNFVNDLSRLLNFLYFNMFVINILVYGGTVICFMILDTIDIKSIITVCISMEIVFLFLALSILANRITDQSAAVGEALYASDWFEASASFKRSMLIVMTRANVPVEFKPPGLDPLSAKNFGDVFTLAYNTAFKLKEFMELRI